MTDLEDPIVTITCSICLDDNIDNPVKTDCSHNYCKKCFEDWLNTGTRKCPMCRKDINTYEYNDDNYKLVLIQPNTSSRENTTESIIIDTRPILERKITFYKFYVYSAFLLLIYVNYIYSKQLYINDLLEDKYQSCMENITDITDILNNENTEYTNVIMMMPDQSFKRCMIPEKYYMYC